MRFKYFSQAGDTEQDELLGKIEELKSIIKDLRKKNKELTLDLHVQKNLTVQRGIKIRELIDLINN